MHRILNIAGNEKNQDDLIEQPVADFIFITSVKADLNLISNLLLEKELASLKNNIRALEISNLNSSAQIDNYLLKTINYAKVVVLRIFGDKGTWNYGIEQLLNWQAVNKNRKLVILSGTIEQEISLCEISSIDKNIALNISRLLRSGGLVNYRKFLNCLNYLVVDEKLIPDDFLNITLYADPYLHDWKNESGEKIGIISYKSLFLANEIEVNEKLNLQLRKCGLSPKTFFISTLKDHIIQNKLIEIFKKEDIKLVITTTAFSSSQIKNNDLIENSTNIFTSLKIPILQLLSSNRSRKKWLKSSIGMNSSDLLMQIFIPEFDGRITTCPSAFKEIISKNLAELKANKVSQKINNALVLGADSVIDLTGELISKPESREEALNILKKLNGKKHSLISSVCISKNGSMVWNYTDKAYLTMKDFSENELTTYLNKISDEALYAYNVYQIEGEGRALFSNIDGDEDTIMGLPIKKIKEYLELQK